MMIKTAPQQDNVSLETFPFPCVQTMNEHQHVGSCQKGKIWRSASFSPLRPKKPSPATPRCDRIPHKLPAGNSPYVRAKHVQLVEKDPSKSVALFWAAINSHDRPDSALKDMATVMKQLNRADEAVEAIRSFRQLCSTEAQESLDNVLLDLYKRCGRIDEQIELLTDKLQLIEVDTLGGNNTMTMNTKPQRKKVQRSLYQERARLLGNLGWAYMQKKDYLAAETLYRKALDIEPDKNKECNLAVCLMHNGRISEAKSILGRIFSSMERYGPDESCLKSLERAYEILEKFKSSTATNTEMNKGQVGPCCCTREKKGSEENDERQRVGSLKYIKCIASDNLMSPFIREVEHGGMFLASPASDYRNYSNTGISPQLTKDDLSEERIHSPLISRVNLNMELPVDEKRKSNLVGFGGGCLQSNESDGRIIFSDGKVNSNNSLGLGTSGKLQGESFSQYTRTMYYQICEEKDNEHLEFLSPNSWPSPGQINEKMFMRNSDVSPKEHDTNILAETEEGNPRDTHDSISVKVTEMHEERDTYPPPYEKCHSKATMNSPVSHRRWADIVEDEEGEGEPVAFSTENSMKESCNDDLSFCYSPYQCWPSQALSFSGPLSSWGDATEGEKNLARENLKYKAELAAFSEQELDHDKRQVNRSSAKLYDMLHHRQSLSNNSLSSKMFKLALQPHSDCSPLIQKHILVKNFAENKCRRKRRMDLKEASCRTSQTIINLQTHSSSARYKRNPSARRSLYFNQQQ